MVWLIVAVVVGVAGFVAYQQWLSYRHTAEIALGFPRIQRLACANPERQSATPPATLSALPSNQYFRTVQNFGLAYSVEQSVDGQEFIHHLSGKAPGKSAKFVATNMLLVMAILLGQFKAANLGDDPKFNIEVSALGTQHLEFRLTPEQHAALLSVIEKGQPAGTP